VPVDYPPVVPGRGLVFPRDHGAHPDYRVEWWYLSGWLDGGDRPRGFQVTFFRLRPGLAEDNPSRFAPRQLLFAHAAIADPRASTLRHAQRAARDGVGAASVSVSDTDARIRDWSLVRLAGGEYRAEVQAGSFGLQLDCTPTQPLLLQGEQGFSRKGPAVTDASYYYSVPQLAVRGIATVEGGKLAVSGRAWLDHEWASAILPEGAVGWDWLALNLDDGATFMAFRMRDGQGAALWAGGSRRDAAGAKRDFPPQQVAFTPIRTWRSPRTGAEYPVEILVRLGEISLSIRPLLDDQELDARRSVGIVYWEGAVEAHLSDGKPSAPIGRGYLEFTGYAEPLRL
jgi:predicted secreted hydrolase